MTRGSMEPAAIRRTAVAALAIGALAALLAGCSPGSAAGGESDADPARLHPVGDPGAWFDPAYASGVQGAYATTGEVCGVVEGLSIEQVRGPSWNKRVQARSLSDGSIVWELPDFGCSKGSVRDGAALIGSWVPDTGTWRLVDATTGETRQEFELDSEYVTARVVTDIDGLRVIELDERRLVGVDGSGEQWSEDIDARSEVTALDDGMLGVEQVSGNRISVLDGRTGERRFTEAGIDRQGFRWASDGYVLRINESDPEYAFYDLDGEEVDRTVGESQYGFEPGTDAGATFPLADHIAAGTVVGVAADGSPALFEGEQRKARTRAGVVDSLSDNVTSVRAVSADGSLLLFDDDEHEGVVVVDDTGEEVLRWGVPVTGLRVEAGYIVVESDSSTQVLLPNG